MRTQPLCICFASNFADTYSRRKHSHAGCMLVQSAYLCRGHPAAHVCHCMTSHCCIMTPANGHQLTAAFQHSQHVQAGEAITCVPVMHKLVSSGFCFSALLGTDDCRLNPLLSRLGPSRTMAQPTPPQLRMQFLNSAPSVAASPAVAPPQPLSSSSHSPDSTTRLAHPTYGSYETSPTFNTTPDAYHTPGLDIDGQQAEDQWQDAAPSPKFDRMFGQHGSSSQQPRASVHGLADYAPSSQQSAGPADSPVAGASQHLKVNASQRDAIKRLAAKRAALSGFASPASSFQSPSRAAGLHHNTLFGTLCIHARGLMHTDLSLRLWLPRSCGSPGLFKAN